MANEYRFGIQAGTGSFGGIQWTNGVASFTPVTLLDHNKNLQNLTSVSASHTISGQTLAIGGAGSFKTISTTGNAVVNGNLTVNGTTTQVDTTNLQVKDKNILINDGGGSTSAAGAGLDIEENGAVTGYMRVADDDRGNLDFKAPNGSELKLDVNAGSTFTVGANLTIEGASTLNQDLTTDANVAFTDVNATIGAQSPKAGSFTTVSGSGLASLHKIDVDNGNVASLAAASVNIDGGAIDGTTIGASSVAAGSFAAVVGTTATFSSTLAANGGLTATTISGSGLASLHKIDVDNADIDGGAIDGTTIGASSVAAGSFAALVGTTATFSSTLTANADTDLGNATSDTITATGRFDSDLVPSTDSARDLGTSALQWAEVHADAGHIDAMTVTGASALTTVTATTISGSSTLQVGGAATFYSNVAPARDGTVDLGSASEEWKDLYIDGVAYVDDLRADALGAAMNCASQAMTNINVDSGAIDGTAIGAASSSTGKFTSISGSSLALLGGSAMTSVKDEDNLGSDSATALATQQSIKAYVDAQVTAQDLDFEGDSGGALSIDLDSETLDIAGGANVSTAGSGNTLTVSLDAAIAGLTTISGSGMASLHKIDVNNGNIADLASANVNIDGGAIDGTVIGANSALAGTFTTFTATTSNLGTLGSNVDHGNFNSTNVDIDSGAIDGTTIGASSVAAGSFAAIVGTTCTLSSNLVANGNVDLGSDSSDSVTFNGLLDSDILADANDTRSLGSSTKKFAAVWATNMYTGDFHMKNERGDWTLFEESDHLRIRNNKTGQDFKMAMIPIEEE